MKHAVITGASTGIGLDAARDLIEHGWHVFGSVRKEADGQRVRQQLGEQFTPLQFDVTDHDAVKAGAEFVRNELKKRNKGLDGLVNNAGITKDTLLMAMKEDQWDAVINTNLTSIYRMSKAVIRGMMKKRGGRIINISSVVGATGNPGQTNYAAAKAGLVGFSKSLAREIGSRGITVNTVAPGFIDTDMTRELAEEQREALASQIPLGRLGAAEEVAAAVVFLASPSAAYITGETIHVNGGMYMP